MEIRMSRSVTFENTLDDIFRRTEPEPITGKNIQKVLEEEAGGEPLVLIIAGVRKGDKSDWYVLREVRRVLAYQSKIFLGAERERCAKEEEGRKQAARTFRLDQIKARIRAERKADDQSFDERYDQQTKEQAEAAETEIEEKAESILKAEEEQTIK